jgi:anti-sigma factor ChrR (cupin superfamily)
MTFSKPTCAGGQGCPDEATLDRFSRGDLEERRAAVVRKHLAICPTTQRALAQLQLEARLGGELREAVAESDPATRTWVIDRARAAVRARGASGAG